MKWECEKCGDCCRYVRLVSKDLDRGDGTCKHLNDDNLCSIYYERPEICRVKTDRYTKGMIEASCKYVKSLVKFLG